MKKILIVVPTLQNGGTISVLKNLLTFVDNKKCNIDIFPITNSGPNYEFIAQYANILGTYIDGANGEGGRVLMKDKMKSVLFCVVKRAKKVMCSMGYDPSPALFKRVVSSLQKNNYDEVIAFQEGPATRLCKYFANVRKVAWVHCDYSKIDAASQAKDRKLKVYDTYDRIVCVSEFTRKQFVNTVPDTAHKTIGLHNLMSEESIIEKGKLTPDDSLFVNYKGPKLVSLGRLHPVKQFSKIAFKLKKDRFNFCWFIIGGDESDTSNIKRNIAAYKVDDCVKMLGNKDNPYPYIKNADLLVCTSSSEACPNVLNEAKILGTPIVSTNFGSATEMMTDGVDGLLSPIENIDKAISRLLLDEQIVKSIKENLHNFKYSNKPILRTLETITALCFLNK